MIEMMLPRAPSTLLLCFLAGLLQASSSLPSATDDIHSLRLSFDMTPQRRQAQHSSSRAPPLRTGPQGWFELPRFLRTEQPAATRDFDALRAVARGVELGNRRSGRTRLCTGVSSDRQASVLTLNYQCEAASTDSLPRFARINPFSFYPGPSPDAKGPIPGSQVWKPIQGQYLHGQFPYRPPGGAPVEWGLRNDGLSGCQDMAQSNNLCNNPIGPFMWHRSSDVANKGR